MEEFENRNSPEAYFEIKHLEIPENRDGWLSPNGYFICCKNGFHDQSAEYAFYLYSKDQLTTEKTIVSKRQIALFFNEMDWTIPRISVMQHGFIFFREGKLWDRYDRDDIDRIATDLQKEMLQKAGLLEDL